MSSPTPPFLLSHLLAFVIRWRYKLPVYIPLALLVTGLASGSPYLQLVSGGLLALFGFPVIKPVSHTPLPLSKSQQRSMCHKRFHPEDVPDNLDGKTPPREMDH